LFGPFHVFPSGWAALTLSLRVGPSDGGSLEEDAALDALDDVDDETSLEDKASSNGGFASTRASSGALLYALTSAVQAMP